MAEPKHGTRPMVIEETPGKKAYCQCGLSAKLPYCDGAHAREGTGLAPVVVEITDGDLEMSLDAAVLIGRRQIQEQQSGGIGGVVQQPLQRLDQQRTDTDLTTDYHRNVVQNRHYVLAIHDGLLPVPGRGYQRGVVEQRITPLRGAADFTQ